MCRTAKVTLVCDASIAHRALLVVLVVLVLVVMLMVGLVRVPRVEWKDTVQPSGPHG
jgi:hypothetical protein